MAKRKGFSPLERSLLAVGLVFLAADLIALLYQSVASHLALRAFDEIHAEAQAAGVLAATQLSQVEQTDFRGWAATRVKAYRENRLIGAPMAVLRIGKLSMRVPVFEGTNELVLNSGAGWIPGTARPGESGNVGIAGHRDGFFRPLKDVARGDTIELSAAGFTEVYTVDQIEIVKPDNVGVLGPRAISSLTLVTCYPFHFIGSAPQRFVVHAALTGRSAPAGSKEIRPGESGNSTKRREAK